MEHDDRAARSLVDEISVHFRNNPGYDEPSISEFASHLAAVSKFGRSSQSGQPSEKRKACYKSCQDEKVIALAAAGKLGWPIGALAAAKAVVEFNACRARCDRDK